MCLCWLCHYVHCVQWGLGLVIPASSGVLQHGKRFTTTQKDAQKSRAASEVGAYICIHVARALLFPCQPSAVSLWYYLMAVLRRSSPLETDRRRAAQRCVSLVTACTQGRRLDLFITFIYIQLTFENTCLKKTQTLKLLHPVKLSCVCI